MIDLWNILQQTRLWDIQGNLEIRGESRDPTLWAHSGVTWVCWYPDNINKGVYHIDVDMVPKVDKY